MPEKGPTQTDDVIAVNAPLKKLAKYKFCVLRRSCLGSGKLNVKTSQKCRAANTNTINRKKTHTGLCMKNPQFKPGNEDFIKINPPPMVKIVEIIPNANARLCFLICDIGNVDDFTSENIFIEIIGKTHGIKFKIMPPNNPNNRRIERF